ncbi:agmatinase [Candidatus Bathyarchaeota archaeon]|nr:agmatinase [Candidatus Bathyarchaeota archaeon]
MSYTKLYTNQTLKFGGIDKKGDEIKYIVLGVPFDFTSTYRPGSRFAPSAIREVSQNLETYCLRNGLDVENLGIKDIGDLDILGDVDGTVQRLQLVLKEILDAKKIPIVLGGEHTVTYGCIKAFNDVAVISFDAHMDLRDEYLGSKLSHATFMRRLCEQLGSEMFVEVGIRAVCKEELDFAEKTGLKYVTSPDIMRSVTDIDKVIKDVLSSFHQIYVTIDMDVLDPAYAPAVGNPIPEGLSPTTLLDILQKICEYKVVGFDVVEVAPTYDTGITALQASHIIFNMMAFIEHSSRLNSSKS